MAITLDSLTGVDTSGLSLPSIGIADVNSIQPTNDVQPASQNNFFGSLQNGLNGLASLFDNGAKIASSVAGASQAINSINKVTVTPTGATITPATTTAVFDNKTVLLMLAVVAGGAALLFIAHKMGK